MLLMRRLVKPLDLQHNLCTLDGGATVAYADTGEVVWSRWLSAETTHDVVMSIGQLCTKIHFNMDSRGRDALDVLTAIDNGRLPVEDAPSVFAIFGTERGQDVVATLGSMANVEHNTPIMGYNNIPELRLDTVLEAVKLSRDLGVLLWHGIAFDDGAIDRVVQEGRDIDEIHRLDAFLDLHEYSGLDRTSKM